MGEYIEKCLFSVDLKRVPACLDGELPPPPGNRVPCPSRQETGSFFSGGNSNDRGGDR